MRKRLTALGIEKLPFPATGSEKYWDEMLPGFGVRCTARSKSFFVMYGKERRLKTIGRFPSVSLSEARREAMRLLAVRPKKALSPRLGEAVSAYISECGVKNRPNTVREYRRYLSALPDKPLSDVKRSDIDASNAHTVMAWRIFFNWCIRNELTATNPFNHIKIKHEKRERVLSEDEIRAIWQYDHEPFASVIKLLLLTGQRRSQIGQFDPDWLNEDTISFPARVMKNGQDHVIPFGDLARRFLPRNRLNIQGWSKMKNRLDKHTGVTGWTLHDLRRTFATLHAQIGTPIHVAEAHLDHKSGTISGVAAVYFRHNWLTEMRNAVSSYETYIATIVES